jgi:hypothetical protein
VLEVPLELGARQAAHRSLPPGPPLLGAGAGPAVELAEDPVLGLQLGELLVGLAGERLGTGPVPVLGSEELPPERLLVVRREPRDRGRELEGLLEEQVPERPSRVDGRLDLVAVDLGVGVVEPVPVDGDEGHRSLAEGRLNASSRSTT